MTWTKLVGLWSRPSRSGDGEVVLVGRLGDLRLIVVPNRDAGTEGAPTHVILTAPAEAIGRRSTADDRPRRQAASRRAAAPRHAADDSDIDDSGSLDEMFRGGER